MNERLKTLSMTFFSGELSINDIMVLYIYLFKKHPLDVIFSLDENNKFVIDFLYENNHRASDYINIKLNDLDCKEYVKYSPMIASELTKYDIIKDDITSYISSSNILKRLIKFYKTNNNKHNKRINDASKRLKFALDKGIDYQYLKDTYII
ncbi:virus assembly crescent formation protein [Brazilian porcupinepox virus 1]|nr:virus assembly crescent formation protein [Brazilian porcupinepox virus 1]